MSWKDRLTWADESNKQRKKASFRGNTFFVLSSDLTIGRRNAIHQYPDKDTPYVEDLGADVDQFNITGYVVQNSDNDYDYFNERDGLIGALRQGGPGTLIHPFYGELQVSVVERPSISEVFSNGGIARFNMSFVKVEEQQKAPYPKKTSDPKNAVDTAVSESLGKAQDGFAKIYNGAADVAGYVATKVQTSITSLNKMLRSVTLAIQGAFPSQVTRALDALSEEYAGIDLDTIGSACSLSSGIIGMFNGLSSLIGEYGEIAASQLFGSCSGAVRGYTSGPFSGAVKGFDSTATIKSPLESSNQESEVYGKSTVDALLAVNRFGESTGSDDPSPFGGSVDATTITTEQRAKESANIVAVTNMARITALTMAARAAVRIKYTSYDSAIEIMEKISEEMDSLLLKLGNDSANTGYSAYGISISDPDSYEAVESLKPIFVNAMRDIGADLSTIIDYKVPVGITSTLKLAYDKYYDISRENEIIYRNIPILKHPGFLPQNTTIEILSE